MALNGEDTSRFGSGKSATQRTAKVVAEEQNSDIAGDLSDSTHDSSPLALRFEDLCRCTNPTVYLIDDDPGIRDAMSLLLGLKNMRVQVFANAEDFLADDRPQTNACILLDIRLPGMGGLQLQHTLMSSGNATPVIIMTANPNVAASRMAFKSGAVDFLSKPVLETELIEALYCAFSSSGSNLKTASDQLESSSILASLTEREREVLDLLVNGSSSRDAAQRLDISHRTVEVYKSRMISGVPTFFRGERAVEARNSNPNFLKVA